ncbi:MAG: hypothetical protein A2X05_08980 [Bacteroidetes bacterium GWE2_41_25]|nr:MAG: hypothetical protein A2X03_04685 [Bacteroidetes bacterium GWA2_40_15]OFY05416.1 MAG: hypothetical protein A2X05_08980 [Bacteroidetes bacterium GWE2_41_25]HBQ82515.1 hypothetical protein [Bacteroidales bacterium]HCU18675.1 hypothetical protein [Bacteroidales bacterium]
MNAGKIFKIFMLLTASVSVILISLSFILRDQVAEIILGSLNRNISTRISVGTFRLSLLKKFPKASLELKDVTIFSSSGFNKDSFKDINTDTLLVAGNLSVDFRITDIIKGVYDIERIGIRNGKITLLTDSAGNINYRLSYSNTESRDSDMTLNLEHILLTEIKVSYNNRATKLKLDGEIKDGRLSSRITRNNIVFGAEAELLVTGVQQNNITINKPFNAGLEIKMEDSDKGMIFRKGSLTVEGFRFNISGSVSNDKLLDLNLSATEIDLSKIRKYLPDKYVKPLSEYNLSGNLQVICQISGMVSGTVYPHLELSFKLSKGGIVYPATAMTIRNISFNGSYSNGSNNRAETSSVTIKDFKALFGSADYAGHLNIRNLKKPVTEIDFTGRIFPGELKQFFRLNNLSAASGYFDLKMNLSTDFWPKDSVTLDDIVRLKPSGSANFKSLTLGLKDRNQVFNNVSGEVLFSNSLIAKNLNLNYRGQNIGINGEFVNLPEWLTGHLVLLKADADISFDRLIPETFVGKTQVSEANTAGNKTFSMPADMIFDINLKIDSLKYDKLPASDISVNLNYKQGMLKFNSLTLKAFSGVISGNGFISQNRDKSLIGRGSFDLDNINIHNTFIRFRNFGQNFLKAENLSGNLTGALSLLLPMDSLLKPQIKSLVAEGKYVISDGALINFEPVKELSSFIELSELEDIRFDKLENDFFIRNNSLYIPQMEVKSSAADLSINGKHNFDNTFEYHAKILLSEILSKKRKKTKSNVTEFGVVEDDGLGRTSLLLKIESQGNNIKVGYDIKAAGDKVKSSIKTERQSLKTILNQEYGMYKTDTVPTKKPEDKKPRFRISWDDSDTLKTAPEPDRGKVKKGNTLKSLLKKN